MAMFNNSRSKEYVERQKFLRETEHKLFLCPNCRTGFRTEEAYKAHYKKEHVPVKAVKQ